MIRQFFCMSCVLLVPLSSLAAEDTSVRIDPPQLQGSRPLERQTESSVVRDYLESWKSMQGAFDANQAGKLDRDFIGTARERLGSSIDEQTKLGLHTHYQERSHHLQIVFYSPEGLSIQLTDTVEYEQQLYEKDKLLGSKTIHQKYVVVMTPSEVRWQVRIFQPEAA